MLKGIEIVDKLPDMYGYTIIVNEEAEKLAKQYDVSKIAVGNRLSEVIYLHTNGRYGTGEKYCRNWVKNLYVDIAVTHKFSL